MKKGVLIFVIFILFLQAPALILAQENRGEAINNATSSITQELGKYRLIAWEFIKDKAKPILAWIWAETGTFIIQELKIEAEEAKQDLAKITEYIFKKIWQKIFPEQAPKNQ